MRRSHRLLVLNQHYPPDTLASGQILAELAEDLVNRHGWQVEVISGWPLRLAEGERWRYRHREERHGVQVIRVHAWNPVRRTPIRRIGHYCSYACLALWRGFMAKRPDVILVMSTPPLFTAFLGWILARFHGAKLAYNIQDLFPDILYERLGTGIGRLVYYGLRRVALFLERRTDAILVIGEKMRYLIEQRCRQQTAVTVISNWSDPDLIVPLKKNTSFAEKYRLGTKLVVGLSGNLGLNQGLESVLAAAELMRDAEDVLWLFIGDGEKRVWLQGEIQRLHLNARWIPYQPKEKLSESLSALDIGLVTVNAGISPFLIPSKLYGLMAAGSCVLAAVDADSEVADFIKSRKIGIVVEPDQPEALVSAIAKMRQEPDLRAAFGHSARQVLVQECSRHACTIRYHEVLEKLIV